jgi:hypothetical protein
MAASVFGLFRGRGLDYEALADRADFRKVRSFAVSRNLGNMSHVDTRDAHMYYSHWVRSEACAVCGGLMWYFLCVAHGVAIELRDGTLGAWRGDIIEHCTLVPSGMHTSDALYAVGMGLYSRVEGSARRSSEMAAALAAKHAAHSLGEHVEFEATETVWVRLVCADGDDVWYRATGDVEDVSADGAMVVCWAGGHGPMRGSVTTFSSAYVHDHVVRAGAVGSVSSEMRGERLVGQRVRVWLPHTDELHAGLVTAFADGAHRVEYDDGQFSVFDMCWDSGAAGFVLE